MLDKGWFMVVQLVGWWDKSDKIGEALRRGGLEEVDTVT